MIYMISHLRRGVPWDSPFLALENGFFNCQKFCEPVDSMLVAWNWPGWKYLRTAEMGALLKPGLPLLESCLLNINCTAPAEWLPQGFADQPALPGALGVFNILFFINGALGNIHYLPGEGKGTFPAVISHCGLGAAVLAYPGA